MVRRLAGANGALALTAARTAAMAATGGYQGLVFDLEGQSRADLPLTLRLIRAVSDSARRRGVSVISVAIPAADTTAYPTRAFMNDADFVIVMLYDEHWSTSSPGPVASPTWVRRNLALRVSDVGANRIVAGFPLYGYLWRPNHPAETISFGDAVHSAAQASVELVRDPASLSLHAIQRDNWELYATDATLLRALRAEASALGVRHVALWRLGLEDPAIWSGGRP
jgi:spore germination protein YaaH